MFAVSHKQVSELTKAMQLSQIQHFFKPMEIQQEHRKTKATKLFSFCFYFG